MGKMPNLSEAEVLAEVERIVVGRIGEKAYPDLVRLLTVCSYIQDLVLVEIENRGDLTYYQDMPIVPDALPRSLFTECVLTRA